MKRNFLAAAGCLLLTLAALGQPAIREKAEKLELKGQFKESAAVLSAAIATKPDAVELKRLEFDLDRLDRIKQDFSYTRHGLFGALKKSMKDLTSEEFDAWVKQGRFDMRKIDGTNYFFHDAVENLFYMHPELYPRHLPPQDEVEHERLTIEAVTSIKKAALAEKTPYVLPKNLDVTMSVTADPDVAAPGETIRAWIPIPRHYPFQTDIKLVSTTPKPKSIDDENSIIRSAYFEQTAEAGKAAAFKVEYTYQIHGVYFDLKPEKIQPYDTNSTEYKHFTSEAPHVVFSPEIKSLSAKIVGSETNPMLKAKKIFDWLSDDLHYSYSLEYSTMRNIGDYCLSHHAGDCGMQGMLFITLCRYNGVPARWQSGWNLFPHDVSNHDWAEIYLAPYGWVPVDQYMGNYAMRYISTLTPEQKVQVRDFYFGGLDQYRMAANSDHSVALNPPKTSIRSDDIDFQRGELEHNGTNIYLNHFSFTFDYKVLPSAALP